MGAITLRLPDDIGFMYQRFGDTQQSLKTNSKGGHGEAD